MMGDANLCYNKWRDVHFLNKKMALQLIGTLDANGLYSVPIGPTFTADHCLTESWLDHVYHSDHMKTDISTKTIKNSSSDHLLVVVSLTTMVNRKIYKRKILKRKMKNFK